MNGTYLGKISSVSFGLYEGRFGLTTDLAFDGSGCRDFIGNPAVYRDTFQYPQSVWDDDRLRMLERVQQIMEDAGVSDISDLKNKPVEVVVQGNALKSWRILKEVL